MTPRFYTLWAINAALDEHELCRQLDQMRGFGFDGVVFHPRFYPNEPPYLGDAYLAILSHAILHAKAIGLEFWIYDENGWPSGTVGGEMQKQHPEVLQQWADLMTEKPADCLGSFKCDGKEWFLARRTGAGVDYFNPDLSRHFIAMTHERYRTGLASEAFAHVSAFFCDEPEFGLGHAFDSLSPHGAIPWTPRLPELFNACYGEELEPLLPLLFFPGERAAEVRVKFWELLTDFFNQSFNTPLNDWCRAHGKRYTAHVKGEEHPLFQVPMTGSCHQVFQHIALPGIDALERFPSGHFFPRQIASVAQQFGNGECMVECFGGAGWGASPENLECYLNWLAGHGLTHFVMHLWQYRLHTHAIQDWPPSHPAHMTWREVYPHLLDRVRRRFSELTPVADTLVVAPYRGIMQAYDPRELLKTNVHNAATYPDTVAGRMNDDFLQLLDRVHRSGTCYHVSDERTIEQAGRLEQGALRLGRCAYRRIVLARGATLRPDAARLVSQFQELGGEVCHGWGEQPGSVAVEMMDSQVVRVDWQVSAVLANHLVVEVEPLGNARFVGRFEAATMLEVDLVFVDNVAEVVVNGVPLIDGRRFLCRAGWNEIHFACHDNRVRPFLAVRGLFQVRSNSCFAAGPNGALATEGPFVVDVPRLPEAADLIGGGLPFGREPVTLLGELALEKTTSELRLQDVHADCAQVRVAGHDCGWCWGPDWSVRLPLALAVGRHAIEVRLVPSTFNYFGPHHHVDGDRQVVSPAQYQYTKNFADRADAPESTRVAAWHFKPFGIGGRILCR